MSEHDFGFRTDFYTFAPETLAQELAEFEILREVGKGSMGIVYEAERRSDRRRVALKVLPPSLTLTDRALARFVKEGEVMARIRHPGIVRVYEHGQKGRLHYFAMEFVDGTTLEERVRIGPLPARAAAEIGVTVAEALQFAHDHGVVHRDVKPGNIIQGADGKVTVTDFGLARETGTGSFTESGAIVGTPMYMAPEQIVGARGTVDSRADVYGLGATLFELVTGRPPFLAPTAQGVLQAVLGSEPTRPRKLRHDLPDALEAIILKALAKRPTHRYASAQEFADDLRRFLADGRVLARRPGIGERSWRAAQRHPAVATLLVTALVLAGAASWLVQERRANRINELIDKAELNYNKATALQAATLMPPTAAERDRFLARAGELATAVLAIDDAQLRAWLIRANVHLRGSDWRAALRDLDAAHALVDQPREDILNSRIYALRHLPGTAARQRLEEDLKQLLRLDPGTNTLCVVAEYLLDLATDLEGAAREATLARADELLARVALPHGRTAIARAHSLELRSAHDAARAATRVACIDFHGDPYVHQRAAAIYARLGDREEALREASMARLLRGEEAASAGTSPGLPPAGARRPQEVDTFELGRFLDVLKDLGTAPANAAPAPAREARDGGREGDPGETRSGPQD